MPLASPSVATAATSAPDVTDARRDLRRERLDDRYFLWSMSNLGRLRSCGRKRIDPGGSVGVVVKEGVAHFTGIATCASIHACPVCAPKIRAERANEIERAVNRWRHVHGGHVLFLTMTIPHDAGDRLDPVFSAVADGFRKVLGGSSWLRDRKDFGIHGVIRSIEVTVGQNGWHPHLHAVLFVDRYLSDLELHTLQGLLHGRWASSAKRHGFAPSTVKQLHGFASHGTRLLRGDAGGEALGKYLATITDETGRKRSLGNELARHDMKQGRRSGRTPWQLLHDLKGLAGSDLDEQYERDLALWHEYEKATKGRRAITWSRGLKSLLLVEERSDEEIAAELLGGEEVARIGRYAWASLVKRRYGFSAVLDAAERHGAAGVYEYLDTLPLPPRPGWCPPKT